MKTSLKHLTGLFSLLFIATSCIGNMQDRITGSKNHITKEVKTKSFNTIESTLVGDIIFSQSADSSAAVKIYGSDNIIALTNIYVKDETLFLDMKHKKRIRKGDKLKITINSPDLKALYLKGVGNALLKGIIQTNKLTLNLEGVGNIEAKSIKCGSIEASTQGVGNIEISGTVGKANYQSDGVGNIEAYNLKADSVHASLNGVGGINCYADKFIKASSNGIGNINYKGTPAQAQINRQGIGKIKRVN